MNKAPVLVGIDIPWFDQLVRLEKMPRGNESVRILESSCQGGGKVSTALVAAARQGIPCKMIAVLGDGPRSRFLLDDFERHDIDVSDIYIKPGYREGYSVVLSDSQSGGRRILWDYDDRSGGLTTDDIDRCGESISRAGFLHICRMDAVDRRAAEIARQAGTLVSFDADFYTPEIADNLSLIDILIGSEEFYGQCFPEGGDIRENIRTLISGGLLTVIFTFGKRGCCGMAGETFFEVPAFQKNIDVVDTVGAGDVFHGAYLAGLCKGMGPEEAARFASAVSAIKCTGIGGRAAIPDYNTAVRYLKTGTFPAEELNRRILFYNKNI